MACAVRNFTCMKPGFKLEPGTSPPGGFGVTCRPQAIASVSAVAQSTKTSRRIILTSAGLRDAGVAALSAVALALAFPKFNQAWLAPLGAAGLFWLWERLSWKRAFAAGWFAGFVFFSISFSWITHALGADLGLIAPFIVVIVAAILALYVGAAGAFAHLAYVRAHPAVAPLAAAASFVVFEWVRSIGPLGVPFEILGYTQVETPLRVYAPYAGVFGVSFIICALGAYIAQAFLTKRNRTLTYALAALVLSWIVCWTAWPARHAAPAD